MKVKYDTTLTGINTDTTSNATNTVTIQLIQPSKSNTNILESTLFVSFVYPIFVALGTTIVLWYFTRKKERADLLKIKTEADKNQEEIKKIKTSYQPIVLSSLQTIQNQLFEDKINALKKLVKFKRYIFHYENHFYEGQPHIESTEDYYYLVYNQFSKQKLDDISESFRNNECLFPTKIRDQFQKLRHDLGGVYHTQQRQYSLKNNEIPEGMEAKLQTISDEFDNLINMIRTDLHFDNSFIHDFIEKYKK